MRHFSVSVDDHRISPEPFDTGSLVIKSMEIDDQGACGSSRVIAGRTEDGAELCPLGIVCMIGRTR